MRSDLAFVFDHFPYIIRNMYKIIIRIYIIRKIRICIKISTELLIFRMLYVLLSNHVFWRLSVLSFQDFWIFRYPSDCLILSLGDWRWKEMAIIMFLASFWRIMLCLNGRITRNVMCHKKPMNLSLSEISDRNCTYMHSIRKAKYCCF